MSADQKNFSKAVLSLVNLSRRFDGAMESGCLDEMQMALCREGKEGILGLLQFLGRLVDTLLEATAPAATAGTERAHSHRMNITEHVDEQMEALTLRVVALAKFIPPSSGRSEGQP